jgi:hypothetical protein
MAKPTQRGPTQVTARVPAPPPTPTPAAGEPATDELTPELPPRSRRLFLGALVIWIGGFVLLLVLLLMESLPLLWDLVRFRF